MKKKSEIIEEEKRINESFTLVSSYLGLEVYQDGTIYWNDDDDDVIPEALTISGNFCKVPGPNIEIGPNEISMDIYNNSRLAFSLLLWYLYKKGPAFHPQSQIFTNKKPDEVGRLIIQFPNGTEWSSYAYYKDSLKVIDLILRANRAVQRDLDILRSLDICDRIDTSK